VPLVRLACPHCGGDLPAPPDAVLFACPACGQASALAGGRLALASTARVPIRLPNAASASGHYPCWVFPVAWTEPADDALAPGTTSPWRRPARIVVPSLAPESGGPYLRLARALSLSADDWCPVDSLLREAAGGQIGEAEAARLLMTVALACVPSALRRKLLEADAPPLRAGPAALAWLPFAQSGGRLLDLVAGIEVPGRLLGATTTTDATAPVSRAQTGAATAVHAPEPAGSGCAR
jgi:hypothetical protein